KPADLATLKSLLGETTIASERFIDCRGFAPKSMLLDLHLDHFDYSYSRFTAKSGFARGRFEHCLFRNVRYGSVLSATFVDCDFSGANFRKVQSTAGCRFESCTFNNSDLSGADLL